MSRDEGARAPENREPNKQKKSGRGWFGSTVQAARNFNTPEAKQARKDKRIKFVDNARQAAKDFNTPEAQQARKNKRIKLFEEAKHAIEDARQASKDRDTPEAQQARKEERDKLAEDTKQKALNRLAREEKGRMALALSGHGPHPSNAKDSSAVASAEPQGTDSETTPPEKGNYLRGFESDSCIEKVYKQQNISTRTFYPPYSVLSDTCSTVKVGDCSDIALTYYIDGFPCIVCISSSSTADLTALEKMIDAKLPGYIKFAFNAFNTDLELIKQLMGVLLADIDQLITGYNKENPKDTIVCSKAITLVYPKSYTGGGTVIIQPTMVTIGTGEILVGTAHKLSSDDTDYECNTIPSKDSKFYAVIPLNKANGPEIFCLTGNFTTLASEENLTSKDGVHFNTNYASHPGNFAKMALENPQTSKKLRRGLVVHARIPSTKERVALTLAQQNPENLTGFLPPLPHAPSTEDLQFNIANLTDQDSDTNTVDSDSAASHPLTGSSDDGNTHQNMRNEQLHELIALLTASHAAKSSSTEPPQTSEINADNAQAQAPTAVPSAPTELTAAAATDETQPHTPAVAPNTPAPQAEPTVAAGANEPQPQTPAVVPNTSTPQAEPAVAAATDEAQLQTPAVVPNTLAPPAEPTVAAATDEALLETTVDTARAETPITEPTRPTLRSSDAVIADFKITLTPNDATTSIKKTQKQHVLLKLEALIKDNFNSNAHSGKLLVIYKELQDTLQNPKKQNGEENDLAGIVRERGFFRRRFGRTNTYQQMSKTIAVELANRELVKFNDATKSDMSYTFPQAYADAKIFTKCHYRGPQLWRSAAKNHLRNEISKLKTKEERTAATKALLSPRPTMK